MHFFGKLIIKFRWLVILLCLGATAFFGYQALNIKVNSDIISYLPSDKEAVQLYKKVGNTFGGNSIIVVALKTDKEDMFNTESLTLLRDIAHSCEQLEGVHNTVSLANILDIRKTEDGISVQKLLPADHVPTDPEELEQIRKSSMSKDMYNGKLISSDGKFASIVVRMKEGVDRSELAYAIKNVVQEHIASKNQAGSNYEAYYSGLPIWTAALSEIILHDITFLIPFVGFVLIIILFIGFRSIRGVVLPLLNVGIATVWTLGLMSMFDVKLTMISDTIPVLLMAVGSAYGIHYMNAYRELMRPGEDVKTGLARVTGRIGVPIMMAALTTLAGFVSFVTSYMSMFREFGVFTAIGVGIAFIMALTLVPALLSFMKVPQPRKISSANEESQMPIVRRALVGLGQAAAKHRVASTVLFVAVAGLCAYSLNFLSRSSNLSEYFEEGHYVRVGDKVLENNFGGSAPIQILVRGDIKDPFVLKQMLFLEKYLDSLPRVTGATSIASVIAETNEQLNGRYGIPDTREGVGNLFLHLEGDDVLERMVYPTGTERPSMGLIQAFTSTADSKGIVETSVSVRNYIQTQPMAGWRVEFLDTSDRLGPNMSAAQKVRLGQVSSLMEMDIRKRLPDSVTYEGEIEPILLNVFGGGSVLQESPELRQGITKAFFEKMSEEFDPTDEEKANATKAFDELLMSGNVDLTGMIGALNKGFSPETFENDAEYVKITATSLMRVFDEQINDALVSQALKQVIESVPQEARTSPWLERDLRGDLLEATDRYSAVRTSDPPQAEGNPLEDPVVRISTASIRFDPDFKGGFGVDAPFLADPEAVLLEAYLGRIPQDHLPDIDPLVRKLAGILKEGLALKDEQWTEVEEAVTKDISDRVRDDGMSAPEIARSFRRLDQAVSDDRLWETAQAMVDAFETEMAPLRRQLAVDILNKRIPADHAQVDATKALVQDVVMGLETDGINRQRAAFSVTGLPRIYEEIDSNLITSQLQSLVLAIVLTIFLLMIQFKSFVAGLISILPIVFTVLTEFGIMVVAGIALDPATVLIASLAVGIGIDYTIHYMARLQIEASSSASIAAGVSEASRTTGVAILINAVSVAAGFLVLMAANLVPLQNFGWMTAVTMLISSFAALTLLPTVVSFGRGPRFLRKAADGNQQQNAKPADQEPGKVDSTVPGDR